MTHYLHDWIGTVTPARLRVRRESDRICLVTFMNYDLGCLDHETCRLKLIDHTFGPKVLPMSPE